MSSAASLYSSVISDVISSIRESFLDEAVDEQVLQELKTLWEQKLAQSKTVDPNNRGQEALLDAKMAAGRSAGKNGKVFILCMQKKTICGLYISLEHIVSLACCIYCSWFNGSW